LLWLLWFKWFRFHTSFGYSEVTKFEAVCVIFVLKERKKEREYERKRQGEKERKIIWKKQTKRERKKETRREWKTLEIDAKNPTQLRRRVSNDWIGLRGILKSKKSWNKIWGFSISNIKSWHRIFLCHKFCPCKKKLN
jgi:hypothetical protein